MASAQLAVNCRRFLTGYWAKSYASAKRHLFSAASCWLPALAVFLACLGVLAIMHTGRHQPQTLVMPIGSILFVLVLQTGVFATGPAVHLGSRAATISSPVRRGTLRQCLSISHDGCTTLLGAGALLLLYALIYSVFFHHSPLTSGVGAIF